VPANGTIVPTGTAAAIAAFIAATCAVSSAPVAPVGPGSPCRIGNVAPHEPAWLVAVST
jgi:hypothetical protein